MLKYKLVILSLFAFCGYFARATTKSINTTYSQTAVTYPLSSVSSISSLSVNGNVVFHHDTSLVRILVHDADGNAYQVFERYPLCSSSKSYSFSNVAEETSLLGNIKPVKITIVALNAKVTVSSYQYSTTTTQASATQVESSQESHLHSINSNKINYINSNKTRYHIDWTADHTGLSDLLFSQRKKYLGNNDNYNGCGYEFYKSGIFSRPTIDIPTASGLKSSSGGTSAFVDSFDWRKLHNAHLPSSPYYDGDEYGGGWATPVRDQCWRCPYVCGSCGTHSALALVEMYTNLYYNKHIDLDLSEQEIISCPQYNCSGVWPETVLGYIKDNDIVDEICFPYEAIELPCSHKCTGGKSYKITSNNGIGYDQNIDLDGDGDSDTTINLNEGLIKKSLLAYGPIAGSHTGHAMLLVGWETDQYGRTVWIFKNSHGYDEGENGYTKEVHGSIKQWFHDYLTGPISGVTETQHCVDMDGDGYFNWGIGSKPSSCPPCTPNQKDWNDDDDQYAVMDMSTGEILPITNPPLGSLITTICGYSSFRYWYSDKNYCGDMQLKYNDDTGNRNIRGFITYADINLVANASMTIRDCTLKVIGGTVNNANIVTDNGKLIVAEDAVLRLRPKDKISITEGSSLVLSKCKIVVD